MVDPHGETVALHVREEIDRLADQFESEFRAQQNPTIESYLQRYAGDRSQLLRELLVLEVELLENKTSLTDYLNRFPNDHSLVRSVLGELSDAENPMDALDEFRQLLSLQPSVTAEAFVAIRGLDCPTDVFEQLLQEESMHRLQRFELSARSDGNRSGSKRKEKPIPKQIGRYDIVDFISEGGFGSVYEARDPKLDRSVAIKTPRLDKPLGDKQKSDFEQEAKLICRLEHANILPVYDFGATTDDRPFLVLKLIKSESLSHRIAERPLSFFEATSIIAQVARALHYAHGHQVVHRDVKPGNILLDESNHAWLTDFGLGLESHDTEQSHDSSGTPLYWSPEQAAGKSHLVDGRSDIFSLGIVLYEAVTQVHPFRDENLTGIVKQILHSDVRPPRQINDRIPKQLEDICLRALRRNPLDRYSTAEDMADELDAVPTYSPQPIDTSGIELPTELQQLQEKLSINTHEIWSAKRLSEGWIVGVKRDDIKKTHPDLVPFEQLSKTEQDYDRDVVESVLKAAIALGARIEPPNPTG